MNGIQLDIPSLSQHNATHDDYFLPTGSGYKLNSDEIASDGVIVYADSSVSDGWCGRASASMIYNYFQRVAAYEAGEGESAARGRFIVNNRDRDSERPLDLIYPDDSVACHDGHSFFRLDEPLERAVSGWDDKTLLSDDERDAYDSNGDALPTLTETEIQQELDPILHSLDRRTPVLAYTGLSTNNARPR